MGPIPRRSASATLIALVCLMILGIILGGLNYMLRNVYPQFHHAYYNEKASCLIDGLMAIARQEAQKNLGAIIAAYPKAHDLKSGVGSVAQSLRLYEDKTAIRPQIVKCEARVISDPVKYFAKTCPYTCLKEDVPEKPSAEIFKDGNELEGIVEITTELSFSGFSGTDFVVPKRTIKAQYEFKRLRRLPPFVRHFALWVKNGAGKGEKPEGYGSPSRYNNVQTDLSGSNCANGSCLFVNASSNGFPTGDLPKGAQSPFRDQVGYVYLGGDDDTFLNLCAGNDGAPYSETFHLYRGDTTDFYKPFEIEFTNFVEKAEAPDEQGAPPPPDQNKGGWLSKAWNWVSDNLKKAWGALKGFFMKGVRLIAMLDKLEQAGLASKSANSPLYYIVRKDYGYAKEWGESEKYRRFGFRGTGKDDTRQTIWSNSLHLYGTKSFDGQGAMSPTLVMGPMYRRFLSLSGYKQRRSSQNPSVAGGFEIQAGPIEYFHSPGSLFNRRVDNNLVYGDEPSSPIWVWDMRVDWNRIPGKQAGTYMPISGWGLVGRLMPGLAKIWEDDKNLAKTLWVEGVNPPKCMNVSSAKVSDTVADGLDVNRAAGKDDPAAAQEKDGGAISPLFVKMQEAGFFTSPHNFPQGQLYKDTTPYFEELSRAFAYTSAGVQDPTRPQDATAKASDVDPKSQAAMDEAGARWIEALDQREADKAWGRRFFPAFDPAKQVKSKEAQAKLERYWKRPTRSGPAGERDLCFPWLMPDPWGGNQPWSFKSKVGGQVKNKEFFNKYFRPLMTNPGMVQPYNYSLRFILTQVKQMLTRPKEERAKLFEGVVPEIVDGIGYRIEGLNDYLEPDDKALYDKGLDDEVLKKIAAARAGGGKQAKYLQDGYFFMDDYGKDFSGGPGEVDLLDVFRERRHCWKMSFADYEKRFVLRRGGKTFVGLNSVVVVTDRVDIGGEDGQATEFKGGGTIIAPEIKISGNVAVSGDKPLLVLVGDKITISGKVREINAVLIARGELKLGGEEKLKITGAILANDWSGWAARGGDVLLQFDSNLKGTGFENAYIENIEPLIYKYHIE